jgi:hypothetical protein
MVNVGGRVLAHDPPKGKPEVSEKRHVICMNKGESNRSGR